MSWREAAKLPLCLLTGDMQNRRIIDHLFVAGGAGKPRAAVETNSVLSLDRPRARRRMVERRPAYIPVLGWA